jgi:hypothetical protein
MPVLRPHPALWLKPDGSHHKLVIQLVANGVAYEAYPSMTGTEGGTVQIPFADFRPAPWDTAHADRRITSEDLANLSQFNIFINQADTGTTTHGTFYLDDLRAIRPQRMGAWARCPSPHPVPRHSRNRPSGPSARDPCSRMPVAPWAAPASGWCLLQRELQRWFSGWQRIA